MQRKLLPGPGAVHYGQSAVPEEAAGPERRPMQKTLLQDQQESWGNWVKPMKAFFWLVRFHHVNCNAVAHAPKADANFTIILP